MKALVTGGTGFVGLRLLSKLESPIVVSRNASRASNLLGDSAQVVQWDPLAGPPPAEALEGVEVVFHLAGESVGEGRWTASKKDRIYQSRIQSTRNLVEGIAKLENRPKVLVCASAIGFYGDQADRELDESMDQGGGFLAKVCGDWEEEAQKASELGVRVVCMRLGIVLEQGGGALQKMLLPFKLGAGGRLGSGRQWMSWIHLDDVVGLLMHAATNETVQGPVNGVAPNPVRNSDFTKVLAKALRRPAIFPAPGFGLKLLIGEFADEGLLSSARVLPQKAKDTGYDFAFPELAPALGHILSAECADC